MTRHYEIAQPGDDDCQVCKKPNLSWPKCENCHTVDAAYLADRVKVSFVEAAVRPIGDGWHRAEAA